MTEPGKALRDGFAAALDGELEYNTVNVPVFDQKVEGTHAMYVLMGKMRDDNRTNKTRFVTEKIFDLELFNVRHATAQSGVLDDIADQILEILIPTPQTIGFTVAGYSVTFCRLEDASAESPVLRDGNKVTHMKRLTFRTRIVQ